MKKKILFISLFLLIAIGFSSCSRPKALEDDLRDEDKLGNKIEEEAQGSSKLELNIPLTKPSTLDPLKNNNITYYNFSKLIYQSLFEFDENLKLIPLLAEGYRMEDGEKTIVVDLKKDVYWHNGDKFTSSDVDFTIKMLKESSGDSIYKNIFQAGLGSFGGFNLSSGITSKIIDENTIEIYFNKAYGNTLETLTFPIVNSASYNEEDYKPIGTGPFAFSEYNTSQGISLLKNEKYWNGEVNIPKINGKTYENDDLMLKAFEDGRVDFAYGSGPSLDKYRNNPYIKSLEYISPDYEFLAYNFKKTLFSGEEGKLLRKAIYYGINRQEIVEEVYLGHASQVDTPIYPDSYLTRGVTNIYGYNKEKAKALLTSLGYEELGSDGILRDKRGKKLSLDLITNHTNLFRDGSAEIIKKNLEEIGIEVVLKKPDINLKNPSKEEIDREWASLNRDMQNGNYDIAILGWELSPISDLSFMFHSSFIKASSNFIGYSDREMDSLLEGINYASQEEKLDMYIEVQEYIMEEIPYASLFFVNKALLLKKNIEGDFKPTFFNLFRGIEKHKINQSN